ncbi:MAG: helix-turn-helix transcriptional regulator [Pseudomonadota bacterium]
MPQTQPSPAELRSMFGTNLRQLSARYPSISELSRQLGINRTQFNRYLAGESFPRPDVLARICAFFDVDARILLEPVEGIDRPLATLTHPALDAFLGAGAHDVAEAEFPSGFYSFTRRSFLREGDYVMGLVHVSRRDHVTVLKGFEAKDALQAQGLADDRLSREFRGLVMRQDDGIGILIARLGGMTASFNYLAREASFEHNFWTGYVTRTIREALGAERAVRMVYEHLGSDMSRALNAARTAGYRSHDQLMPFHQRLLRDGQPFR